MTDRPEPDSELTRRSWDEHNLSQLRYFRSLSLREKLQAVEGMADVVRRFQQMRETGKFSSSPRSGHAASPPGEAHAQLEPTTGEADNATHELEASNQALARAPAGGAGLGHCHCFMGAQAVRPRPLQLTRAGVGASPGRKVVNLIAPPHR